MGIDYNVTHGYYLPMEKLRLYLNSLSFAEQQAYAAACGTSVNYLRKAISKGSKFDGALARKLDQYSNGHVHKFDLRPDIWPELAVNDNKDIKAA